jgi:4'-phosphopantetheinyl transferase
MEPEIDRNPAGNPALRLWYAYPGDLADPAAAQACAALLTEAERARAARFHFDRHRREYLATHALARIALSHAHPLPPQEWRYAVNAYGKPSPLPECGVRFNQSNSVELAVCLVSAPPAPYAPRPGDANLIPEVGVDVEALSRAEEIVRLAPDVFSPAERRQLDELPAVARSNRAVSLWTLKEAYMKARGVGLLMPLRAFSFVFGDAQKVRLEVDPGIDEDPERWRFTLLNHASHRIALVVEVAVAGALQVWEAHPLPAVLKRLPNPAEPWFPLPGADHPPPLAR